MYQETTRGVRISVTPNFVDEQSIPEKNQFIFAYHVVIENLSEETVQLLARYWRITDARGRTQEVRGQGVVGEQPVLETGERFDYTSGAPLATSSGFMGGYYEMVTSGGERFNAAVPAFSLDGPSVGPKTVN